jgi:hypothetical protein
LIFLDTSAIYAWTDRGDSRYAEARECLAAVLECQEALVIGGQVRENACTAADSGAGAQAHSAVAPPCRRPRRRAGSGVTARPLELARGDVRKRPRPEGRAQLEGSAPPAGNGLLLLRSLYRTHFNRSP